MSSRDLTGTKTTIRPTGPRFRWVVAGRVLGDTLGHGICRTREQAIQAARACREQRKGVAK